MRKNERMEFNDWEAVDFFGVPKKIGEDETYKPTFTPAKSPLLTKDKKLSILKAPSEKKLVPFGSAIAKPDSTVDVGVKSGETDFKDGDLKTGDPEDGKGDVMQGKGNSDDQQKDLPTSMIKTGKPADGRGKIMSDSVRKPGQRVSEARRNQVSELMKKSMVGKIAEERKKKMQEKLQKRYGK